MSAVTQAMNDSRLRKPDRLSRACNACRARKVRCDENQPSCNRCLAAGVACVTTDPKSFQQLATGARRRARSDRGSASVENVSRAHNTGALHPWYQALSPTVGGNRAQRSTQQRNPRWSSQAERSLSLRQDLQQDLQRELRNSQPSNEQADLSPGWIADPHRNILDGLQQNLTVDSPDFALNTASLTEQKYLGASNLQVFSQWLEMTFHVPVKGLANYFQYGMRHCEEMDMPATPLTPHLPPNTSELVQTFFKYEGRLFAVTDEKDVASKLQGIPTCYGTCQETREFAHNPTHRQPFEKTFCPPSVSLRERPGLVIIYAIIAIGSAHSGDLEQSRRYIDAACSLYAYTVAYPYLTSAQALILINLSLRCCSKDGAGTQALGQAIRILQSIGLHRKTRATHQDIAARTVHVTDLGRRVWWSAYCLEQISAFETGRPSIVSDNDIDQDLPKTENGFLECLVRLCQVQGRISTRLFTCNAFARSPAPELVFQRQAELDADLVAWETTSPRDLRPELNTTGGRQSSIQCAFLAIQYYGTLITLHRPALLMHHHLYTANVDRSQLPISVKDRLKTSESLCVNAARKVATTFLEASEMLSPRFLTMTAPLMAIYVLTIYTLKHPSIWSARSDIGLVQAAAEAVEGRYRADGQDPSFYSLLTALQRFASPNTLVPMAAAARARQIPPSRAVSTDGTTVTDDAQQNATESQSRALPADQQRLADEWDAIFPRLFTGDLPFYDQSTTNTETLDLMDIPQFSDEDLLNFTMPSEF